MKYLMLLLVMGLAPLPLVVHASNDVCTSCDNNDDDKGGDVWDNPQPDDVLAEPDANDPSNLNFAGETEDGLSSEGADLPQLGPLTPQPEPIGLPQ